MKLSIRKGGPSTNLTQASNQWAERPADERFWTTAELAKATQRIHEAREIAITSYDDLRASYSDIGGLRLDCITADMPFQSAAIGNWGFRQLTEKIGAPASYLRSLPGRIVADLVNHGLRAMGEKDREARVSVRTDMALPHVECFMSGRYGYIPNFKIAEGLQVLEKEGWRTAPARPAPGQDKDKRVRRATKADVLYCKKAGGGAAVKEGDLIGPAGLYAGDQDMFAFLIHESKPIDDGSGNHGLHRGMFVRNSEIGKSAFELTTFLYDGVCGNHIVWGASDIHTLSVRHIGNAEPRAFAAMERDLAEYTSKDGGGLTKLMKAARKMILGPDKESVALALFNNRSIKLGLRDITRAYELCEQHDADRMNPASLWGMVTGVTRLSQEESHVSSRLAMDEAVGKMMALVN